MKTTWRLTKNPLTDSFEEAKWIDHYFAHGVTGVAFKDGTVYNPAIIDLKVHSHAGNKSR